MLIGTYIFFTVVIMFTTKKSPPLPRLIHFSLNLDLTEINMTIIGFIVWHLSGLFLFFLFWSAFLNDFVAVFLKQ